VSAPSSSLWVNCPAEGCGSLAGQLCRDRRDRAVMLSGFHFLRRVAFEAAVAAAEGRQLLRPDHRGGCNKQRSGAACNCGVDWTIGLEEALPGVPWSRRAPEDESTT